MKKIETSVNKLEAEISKVTKQLEEARSQVKQLNCVELTLKNAAKLERDLTAWRNTVDVHKSALYDLKKALRKWGPQAATTKAMLSDLWSKALEAKRGADDETQKLRKAYFDFCKDNFKVQIQKRVYYDHRDPSRTKIEGQLSWANLAGYADAYVFFEVGPNGRFIAEDRYKKTGISTGNASALFPFTWSVRNAAILAQGLKEAGYATERVDFEPQATDLGLAAIMGGL